MRFARFDLRNASSLVRGGCCFASYASEPAKASPCVVRVGGEPGSGRSAVLLAVAVATAGVLPGFLTGGLAAQIRGEFGFGEGALGFAVAVFFAASALASLSPGVWSSAWGIRWGCASPPRRARPRYSPSPCSRARGRGSASAWSSGAWETRSRTLRPTSCSPARFRRNARGWPLASNRPAIPAATLLAGLAVPLVAMTVGWRWAFAGAAALALCVALLVPKGEKSDTTRRVKEARVGDTPLVHLVLLALGIGLGSAAANPLGAFVVESAVAASIRVGAGGLLLALGSAAGMGVRVVRPPRRQAEQRASASRCRDARGRDRWFCPAREWLGSSAGGRGHSRLRRRLGLARYLQLRRR